MMTKTTLVGNELAQARASRNPAQVWQAALGELMLQTTKATFDTWIKPTFALGLSGNELTVGVRNAYAKQWLDNRLGGMVERAVSHVMGGPTTVKFVLKTREDEETQAARRTEEYAPTEKAQKQKAPATDTDDDEPKAGDVIVEVFQNPLEPFLQVQKYAIWFWQPLLGSTAFATWVLLRTHDRVNDGIGKKHRVSVQLIAETLKVNRQEITGVRRGKAWQPGAFDVLNEFGIAKIVPIGKGAKTLWWAKVMNSLPLLTPKQVEQLTPLLQERQEGFLEIFRIDYENWEQLPMDSLVKGFE